MWNLVVVIALILTGIMSGTFAVVIIGIRTEDSKGSATGRAPGRVTAGVRRILGLHVDHTCCRYVSNPEYACPKCHRAFHQPQARH
ncbi:hypothetical protein [Planomonospora sp. ID82291]|uniref:hypothetical protein n=1 Tax=Planomonospora sp. ID82291 TaxID=2738136 RepID=UPI0018C42B2C|nr:hypothetical protein [Planomonospora sp. ID82291]MBG0814992.1 hypothetical protein [Planomonospora sp. ID82291]